MSTSEEHDSIQIDLNAPRSRHDSEDSIEIGHVVDNVSSLADEPSVNGADFFAALLSGNAESKSESKADLFESLSLFDSDASDSKDSDAQKSQDKADKKSLNIGSKQDASSKDADAASSKVKDADVASSKVIDEDEDTNVFHAKEIEEVENSGKRVSDLESTPTITDSQPIKRERKASVKIVSGLLSPTVKLPPEDAEQLKPAKSDQAEKLTELSDKPKTTEVDLSKAELSQAEANSSQPEKPEALETRGLHGSTVKLAPEEAEQIKPKLNADVSIEERQTIVRCPATPSAPNIRQMEPDELDIDELDIDNLEVPDLSSEPVRQPSEFERTIVFEKTNNRWDAAHAADYQLPNVGDKVGGNYEIIDELGRGGFGAVYRAKNLTLGREEALKLILPAAKSEVGDIDKRFEREIDIVSRLEHPNIVRLYSSGALEYGVLWMTMELVKGNRLDERLKQYGAMKFEKAKNLMLQLLSGLMEAHRRQIVHRDLKPANIILSKKEGYADQVVILDFGLSKALGASEDQAVQNVTVVDSRRVYGTPQYISPEQLTTGKLGPWTDVYAAGLIFYELLTGMPAVDGESLFDIAYKQSYEPIVFPENLRDTVIEAIINKACAKNPADRYKHAGEFFDALQHVEDISDPLSVLRDSSRGGQNLASIGMLEKTRDETAEMKTQIGLSAIVADEDLGVPVQHAEHTKQHRSIASSLLLVATTFISIVFILVIVAWFLGYIEVALKF